MSQYLPGSALQYHVILNNVVPHALGRELLINSEMAQGKPGVIPGRYDDINTIQLSLRSRIHRSSVRYQVFTPSVIDLAEGV